MSSALPVAIITGAGRGIGRATAIELAKTHRVVLVSRSVSELQETSALCGEGASVVPVDVRDPDAITAAVKRVVDEFGRVDALVNNAGFGKLLPLVETDRQTLDDTIAVNLAAPFQFTQAVWKPMIANGGGVVVNISSMASRDPFQGFSAYGATKAGLNLLTLALAREGKPHNIRVHGVAPAGVETALLRTIVSQEQYPTQHTLSPEDVARVIVQCISGDLRHTSGETIFLQK